MVSRRQFVKGAASSLALLSTVPLARAQSSNTIRLEWHQFITTPQYASFLQAIGLMRTNSNAADPSSLQFWANVHMNHCPHGAPYFVAWHRGYLFLFEQQMGLVSGDPSLALPYWDYFSDPSIPAEFADPSPSNPLYMPRNVSDVSAALDYSAFDPSVYNFQRGTVNAFEPLLEAAPHNPVHDLIGGVMGGMQSPLDPIFFVHHANIDRVTHAWALPDGKGIPYTTYPYSPATSDPYWSGSHVYTSSMTMERYKTCDPTWLGYDYSNDQVPVPPAQGAAIVAPAAGTFQQTPGHGTSNGKSLGGAGNVRLAEKSTAARLLLPPADAQALRDALSAAKSKAEEVPAGAFQSAQVVLDNIGITDKGKQGGFFYKLYLNMPDGSHQPSSARKYFLGTLGPFQVDCAKHHGSAQMVYPATEILCNLGDVDLREIRLSWVRFDAATAPKGAAITIGEARIEISTEAPWDRNPPTPRPPYPWYS